MTTSQPAAIETRGVEVAEVVEPQTGQPGGLASPAPVVARAVLVQRAGSVLAGEQPPIAANANQFFDVPCEHGHKPIGEEHRPLAAVLRRPDLDFTAGCSLNLPLDREGARQESDVAYLHPAHLSEPESGERGECDPAAKAGSMVASKRPIAAAVGTVIATAAWRRRGSTTPLMGRSGSLGPGRPPEAPHGHSPFG